MTLCSNMQCGNTDCENHYVHIVNPGKYEFVDMKKACQKQRSQKKSIKDEQIEVDQ